MYHNPNQIEKIYRFIFKYNFKVVSCTDKGQTIDIDLADPDGLKRTLSLAKPSAIDEDPRWETVNRLYSEGRDLEGWLHENEIMEEYIYGKESK